MARPAAHIKLRRIANGAEFKHINRFDLLALLDERNALWAELYSVGFAPPSGHPAEGVKLLAASHAALRARCERLEGALNESCVLSYISKHAADCRQENQRAGYEVYGQATFEAIQADYDRIVAALAQPEDGK